MPNTQDYKDSQLAGMVPLTSPPTFGSQRWIALGSTVPNQAGAWTEITTGGIARVQLTASMLGSPTTPNSTTNRQVTNVAAIQFPTTTAATADAVAWAIFDSQNSSGSNKMVTYGSMTNQQIIAGVRPTIDPGTITIIAGDLP